MQMFSMMRFSHLRSVLCILRGQTGLHNSTQFGKRFTKKRFSYVCTAAKFSSDASNTPVFQQFEVEPKIHVKSAEEEDNDILKALEDKFSHEEYEYALPSHQQAEFKEVLWGKFHQCKTANEVFHMYTMYSSRMNANEIIFLLKKLRLLVLRKKAKPQEIQDGVEFQDMCQKLLKMSAEIKVRPLISLLLSLSRLQVDTYSRIVQISLQLLRHSVNDLDLTQLAQVVDLLKRFPPTPLSRGILEAVPPLMENALKKESLKGVRMRRLSQILSTCVSYKIQGTGIVLQEIYRRGNIFSSKLAIFLLWTLLDLSVGGRNRMILNKSEDVFRQILIKTCLKSFTRTIDTTTFSMISKTLSKVAVVCEEDFSSYNEEFLHTIAQHCIRESKDCGYISYVLQKMLMMNYLPENLVDHLASVILEKPDALKPEMFFHEIVAGITAVPVLNVFHLDALKLVVNSKALNMNQENYKRMFSLPLVLRLLSIGYFYEPLLELFTSSSFLERHLCTYKSRTIALKQILAIDQLLEKSPKSLLRCPEALLMEAREVNKNRISPTNTFLHNTLCQIYGDPGFVVSGVLTDNDVYIDHLLVMDERDTPVKFGKNECNKEAKDICDLNIPTHYKRIAVVDVSPSHTYAPKNILKSWVVVNQQLLKASGFVVVPVFQTKLNQLAHNEKSLYIKTLISSSSR